MARYAHCTSIHYNQAMTMTADQATSDAGLIYRVRRGAPRSPLILMLHGLSGDENVMWLFDHALPRSATVISPRALFPAADGFSWTRSVGHGEMGQTDFTAAIEALQRFIPEMIQRYELRSAARHRHGLQSGRGSELRVVAGPARFDVRRDCVGGVYAENRACDISAAGLRALLRACSHAILIIHSSDDDIVPIALAREARSELEARGALVEYHEYPGGGHKVSAQGMKDIAQWIERILS